MVLAGLKTSRLFFFYQIVEALLLGYNFPVQFRQRDKMNVLSMILVQSESL
jgi:hypothetical protein